MLLERFIGALIFTYWASRLARWVTRRLGVGGIGVLLLAHAVSWCVIAGCVGFLKAYFSSFAFGETMIYLPAQIVWLAIDVLRLDSDERGFSGGAAS